MFQSGAASRGRLPVQPAIETASTSTKHVAVLYIQLNMSIERLLARPNQAMGAGGLEKFLEISDRAPALGPSRQPGQMPPGKQKSAISPWFLFPGSKDYGPSYCRCSYCFCLKINWLYYKCITDLVQFNARIGKRLLGALSCDLCGLLWLPDRISTRTFTNDLSAASNARTVMLLSSNQSSK